MDFKKIIEQLGENHREMERIYIEFGNRGEKDAKAYYKGMADAFDMVLDMLERGEALKDPSKIEPIQFGVEDILFWREHSNKSSKNQKKDDKKGDK